MRVLRLRWKEGGWSHHFVGHHVQYQKLRCRKYILFGSDTSSTIEHNKILAHAVVAMPPKKNQIRCDQTPCSNQGLQTKRGNSIFWFCYRRSKKQRMHLQYPCVVWHPFGDNSVPFPTSQVIFHIVVFVNILYVVFNIAMGLQLFVCALSPVFGNIMNKVFCHVGVQNLRYATLNWKFATSTWIGLHLQIWTFQPVNRTRLPPFDPQLAQCLL